MGQISERLFINGLSVLPKNAMSRAVGGLAHLRLPAPLSTSSIRSFVKLYNINSNEAECDLESYHSIGDFFARRLKMGSRVIDHRPGHVVSPADGRILNCGRIENGTIIQAKGRDFSVSDLLGSQKDATRFDGGSWVTVYLSPKDYHRVHHPVEGQIKRARYLPGRLWPVNQAAVNHVDRLFCVNERLATFVDTPIGMVTTVMVGATSVGHITVRFDEDLQTNKNSRGGDYHYPEGPRVARGDELGTFHLGSTAIVLIESKEVVLDNLEPGQPVRMGGSLGRLGQKKGR
jgi:phosphatidylserine decarboxylase